MWVVKDVTTNKYMRIIHSRGHAGSMNENVDWVDDPVDAYRCTQGMGSLLAIQKHGTDSCIGIPVDVTIVEVQDDNKA